MNKHLIASLILGGFAANAHAASPNYDKLEIGYTSADYRDGIVEFDVNAYNVAGSMLLSDHFFVQAGYVNNRDEDSDEDFESRTYNIGLGFRAAIVDSVDFNATVDYLNTRTTLNVPQQGLRRTDTDSMFGFGLGLRAQVTEPLELALMVKRTSASDIGDAAKVAQATANYNFTDHLGLYMGYSRSLETSDADAWTLGARFSF